MKVLITGANGAVGGEAVRAAITRGHRVLAMGRGPCRLDIDKSKFIYRDVDVNSAGEFKSVAYSFLPDIIIHAAAMTDVDLCERHPPLAWLTNVDATRSIALVAKSLDARFVYVSTDSVFDGKRGSYFELDTPNPLNVYSRTKLAGEYAARDMHRSTVIARIGPVYGGRRGGKLSFADRVIDALRAGQEIYAFTDQICSPTLADALGPRLVRIGEGSWTGELHCSDAVKVSRYDFALALAKEFGLDGELVVQSCVFDADLQALRPLKTDLDTSMCTKTYPEFAPLSLSEALRVFKENRR